MTLGCPLGQRDYQQTVNVLSCQNPERGCGRRGKVSRRTQNNVKWGLNRQRAEGIAAEGGCPPPAQDVPSLASQYQKKKSTDSCAKKLLQQ